MSGRHLKRAFARFFNYLLAPGLCLACGCGNDGIDLLCADCAAELRAVPNPCRHCGKPNPLEKLVCPACLLNPPRWQQLIAPLQYRGLTREYLLQLKYAEAIYLAKCLGLHCLERMQQYPLKPEALLPVPLHRERLFERGFNQAQEIAAVWARPLGIALDRNA